MRKLVDEIEILVSTGQANLAAVLLDEALHAQEITPEQYRNLVIEYKEDNRVDLSDGGRRL